MYEAWGFGAWGQNGPWGRFAEPEPYVYRYVAFKARPTTHHGRQRGSLVVLSRERADALTLPRRENASPIPQGSNHIQGDEPTYYGEGYYGDIWYGE